MINNHKDESPLLSLIATGRNDGYIDDYIYKLEYSLNFMLTNAKKQNILPKLDINYIDWGSERPLAELIRLKEKDFLKNINFIYVDKDTAEKLSNNITEKFNDELATNILASRCKGKFVMYNGTDQFLSNYSMLNLIKLLDDKLDNNYQAEEKIFLMPRKILNRYFYKKKPSFESLNYYLDNLNHCNQPYTSTHIHSGGGMGSMIVPKKFLDKIGGYYNEKLPYFGLRSRADNDLLKRSSYYLRHIDLSYFGINIFKFPRSNKLRNNRIKKLKNRIYYSNYEFRENLNLDWGLKKQHLQIKDTLPSQIDQSLDMYHESNNFKDYFLVNYKNRGLYKHFYQIFRIAYDTIFQFKDLKDLLNSLSIIQILDNTRILRYIELGSESLFMPTAVSKSNNSMEILVSYNDENIGKKNITCYWDQLSKYFNKRHEGYFSSIQNNNVKILSFFLKKNFSNNEYLNFINLKSLNQNPTELKKLSDLINENSQKVLFIACNKEKNNYSDILQKDNNFLKVYSSKKLDLYINQNMHFSEINKKIDTIFNKKFFTKILIYISFLILSMIGNLKKKLSVIKIKLF